jgi:predicted GIY-YIG superfamily endonuclease
MNYIYCLSHPITDETVYIGKTKDPIKRFKDHCRKEKNYYKTNLSKWKNLLFIEGLKPVLTVIDENENDIDYWEKYYISLFKSWGINLLNMTEGGDGLQNPSEETRKKIGEKSKGRKMSDKTKQAIFKATYNCGKKILCYDINKNFIGIFNNARRAEEILGISYKNISDILNCGMHFHKNYTFFFEKEDNIDKKLNDRISKTSKIGEIFYRVDIFGNKKEYSNLMDADRDNNISFKNIWMCLNKKRKTTGKFAWIYKTDQSDYKSFFIKETRGKKIKACNNHEIIEFNSINAASIFFKMRRSTIVNYIKNKQPKNGFIFEYVS